MKVITVSDNPNICTGLARIHRHFIDAMLADGHSVLPCVWFGYDTETTIRCTISKEKFPNIDYKGLPMLDIPRRDGSQKYEKIMCDICNTVKPDLVVTIGDYWDFYYMKTLKSKMDFSFKWLAYLTIEMDIDQKYVDLLGYADAIAVPSEYAKSIVQSTIEHSHFVYADGKTRVESIPLGIEPSFSEQPKTKGEKVRILTVAQNTWRKNLPVLIQAAARLRHGPYHFYVHTCTQNLNHDAAFFDLKALAEYFNVQDMFTFPTGLSNFAHKTDAEMAELYNAADMFVLPSTMESFAFPVLEAMACGLPVAVNPTAVMPEHIGDPVGGNAGERGWAIAHREEVVPPARVVRVATPSGVAEAIKNVHSAIKDGSVLRKTEAAKQYVGKLTWGNTKRKMTDLVNSLEGEATIPIEIL